MREVTGPEEPVCGVRTECPYTLLFRFGDSRDDDLLFFLTEQACVTCVRVERQHRDTGFVHAEITQQTLVEQRQFG